MRISDWSSDVCSSDLHDDEESWPRFINYYYNCLRDVDRRLGQLLWALKESGQIDNTIIIYTSDHGERAGAHGMRQKGATMYREEVNIPMIVAHPDFPGGTPTKGPMGATALPPHRQPLPAPSA